MPEKPLCKDCRWHLLDAQYIFNPWCNSPKADHSLVDGAPMRRCNNLRYPDAGCLVDVCGPEGKWFEAKESAEIELFTVNLKRPLPLTALETQVFLDLVGKIKDAIK